ncbi:MAG: hypothetical protein L0J68_03940 [Micrococcaceae bacterium]|nr:hypothetical protein [Micrococcaceae bacterium]MDN5813604.1 hypothetical protein [Micrococcaceae bacterium]MDN5824539.1 hypothetical protein [Micrococcaceae bacterium]MDN5879905.1 hypothetical protein [Micrococcaceae bacterium]MDN5886770.1 hypothetical protein [Micrococcaceae bacterium]
MTWKIDVPAVRTVLEFNFGVDSIQSTGKTVSDDFGNWQNYFIDGIQEAGNSAVDGTQESAGRVGDHLQPDGRGPDAGTL